VSPDAVVEPPVVKEPVLTAKKKENSEKYHKKRTNLRGINSIEKPESVPEPVVGDPVVTNPEVAVAVVAIFVVMCLTSDQSGGGCECVT